MQADIDTGPSTLTITFPDDLGWRFRVRWHVGLAVARVGAWLLACGLGLIGAGCGASWQDVARTSIEASAVMVDSADTSLASAISRDCHHDGLDACLTAHKYDTALSAISTADASLRAAQAVVDAAARAGREHDWLRAAPCLGLALHHVVEAITAAGIVLPAEVLTALTAIEVFVGTCPAGGA